MKKILVALMVVLSTGAIAQQKLGHVNSQVLMDTMPSTAAAMEVLQKFEAEGVAELKEMEAALRKGYMDLEVKAKGLSPLMLQIEQEKLQKKEQSYSERKQSLQREIQAITQSLNDPLVEQIQKAIKIVADRNKINYVLDQSTTLYYESGIDLTDQVAKELLRLDAEANQK